jgi:predicted ATPase
MITRIEIDGFKSFYDFSVDLQPFTVLIGANGTGKSNLFDALKLLSHLADGDRVAVALNKIRGGAREAFALKEDGTRYDTMRFAVEMLVDREVRDNFGATFITSATALRYEVEILSRSDGGIDRIAILREHLNLLKLEENRQYKYSEIRPRLHELRVANGHVERLIYTEHPKIFAVSPFVEDPVVNAVGYSENIILANLNTVFFKQAFATRREMQSWRTLHLIPDKLREPSKASELYDESTIEADGANLPNMLERMRRQDEASLHFLNLKMGDAVPSFYNAEVVKLEAEDKLALRIETTDRLKYWADSISDGTLRMLAYAALHNDEQLHGVWCIEEPENGISPLRLKKLLKMLRETATDFSNERDAEYPLRQVIISSHSPLVAQAVPQESIRLAVMPVSKPHRTRIFSILPDAHEDLGMRKYVQMQYEEFIDADAQPEAEAVP